MQLLHMTQGLQARARGIICIPYTRALLRAMGIRNKVNKSHCQGQPQKPSAASVLPPPSTPPQAIKNKWTLQTKPERKKRAEVIGNKCIVNFFSKDGCQICPGAYVLQSLTRTRISRIQYTNERASKIERASQIENIKIENIKIESAE